MQHEVPQTLHAIKEAGIKVWILTGDKIETTKTIARACNLIDKMSIRFKVSEKSFEEVDAKLKSGQEFTKEGADLVSIDGFSFALACSTPETEQMLINIISKAKSVIFARLSPA